MNQNGIPTSVDPTEAEGDFAKKARTELEESEDAILVGTAGNIVHQYGSILLSMRRISVDYSDFAEKLLKKAQDLQPTSVIYLLLLA